MSLSVCPYYYEVYREPMNRTIWRWCLVDERGTAIDYNRGILLTRVGAVRSAEQDKARRGLDEAEVCVDR